MSSLGVWWGREKIGLLEQLEERSREYTFRYVDTERPISVALPIRKEPFTVFQSRAFFEALLPEGPLRERLAVQLKVAASDSFRLLSELGRDCAGALQVLDGPRMSEAPSVDWLDDDGLDLLIADLPRHPLGVNSNDTRMRLSLAGVQNKAVLVRDENNRFGRPLSGMPSTHILKPEPAHGVYPGLATNEFFCMRLARRCGLPAAAVEIRAIGGGPCLVVERYDRTRSVWPPERIHQEDLCQALGVPPDFKYQRPDQTLPSYQALAAVLDAHAARPGIQRLAASNAVVFHFLVGNADAHAKNISLVHDGPGVSLAPLYDVVSTAAYPELDRTLAISIGDEFDPDRVGPTQWDDLATDMRLRPSRFVQTRSELADRVSRTAAALRNEAITEGWHHSCIDKIIETITARTAQLKASRAQRPGPAGR